MTLCPSLILGEVIGCGEQTSAAVIKRAIKGEIPGWPLIRFNTIDVKECALAHVRALERPEAANKRFLLSGAESHTYPELAAWLDAGLKQRGYNYSIATRQIPGWAIRFGAFFSNDLDSLKFMLNEPPRIFNNNRSREILGLEYKKTA